MGTINDVLDVEQLVLTTINTLVPLISQAYQAWTAGDQVTLDKIHTQAVAASEALKPDGAPEVAVSDVQ